MRKIFPLLAASVLFSGLTLAIAAEEKTLTGDAVCAKCALAVTKSCQNTLSVDDAGKKTMYYLEHNAVSKKAHGSLGVCTAKKDAPIKLTVVGTVKEEDGKHILTASKIEKAK